MRSPAPGERSLRRAPAGITWAVLRIVLGGRNVTWIAAALETGKLQRAGNRVAAFGRNGPGEQRLPCLPAAATVSTGLAHSTGLTQL